MAEDQENTSSLNDLEAENEAGSGERMEAHEALATLQADLAKKTEEAKAFQDKYVRLVAEMENYKRLSQREQRESIRFGNESILRDVLPAIDNLERAIKASRSTSGSDALIQGVELTLKQLLESLGKFGVKPIDSLGQPFDPTHHQAVAQVESSTVEAGHVVDEFQKGYWLHDRVLRAAMVSVASAATSSDA